MNIVINIIQFVALLTLTFLATLFLEKSFKKRKFKTNRAVLLLIMSVITAALYLVGGMSLWTVKGIVLALILLYASVQDISTHEADDHLWVMLLIIALVHIGEVGIVSMVFGGLVVFVPQMFITLFTKEKSIGGADIKISTAAALCLGFYGGGIGFMLGLLFAVVYKTITNRRKKQSNKEPFALLPFLSTGLVIGYFI